MKNEINKTRLIDLIFEYIINHRSNCLQILRANKIFLSKDGECTEISLSSVNVNRDLSSNQEEADTKVILHALNVLHESQQYKIHLRSPSGDTDIPVIALGMIPYQERIYYDSGVRKNRRCILLSDYVYPKKNGML